MFSTDTLTLAAWLRSEGYELDHTEKVIVFSDIKSQLLTIFHFKSKDGIVDQAEAFRLGKAFGCVNNYEYARRDLMRIAKER